MMIDNHRPGPAGKGGDPQKRPHLTAMEGRHNQAEAIFRQRAAESPQEQDAISPEAMRRTLHELGVHQIELEMQNEELRESKIALDIVRKRYFDLYDLAPVGYCTLSRSGLILQSNLLASTVLGVGRSALIGQPFSRFLFKECADRYQKHRRRLLETAEPQTVEVRLVNRDGRIFWVQLTATLGPEEDGKTVVRVIINNIDERKRAESALREQREFFHLIAENIEDFISVLDPQGRRLYNSPSFTKFFGATSDLVGSDSFVEIHPEDQERLRQIFRETVETGEGRQTNYRLLRANGEVRDMESTGSAIRDHQGQVERVLVVSRDITERRRIEDQVRQLAFHDVLTQLPNRRLLNDRLTQAVAASSRRAGFGALMFLDLDDFKRLNDSRGHGVGDLLLIQVAERLKSCVREMDTVARFGGDEFVVMISELDPVSADSIKQVHVIAEKIRVTLAAPYVLAIRRAGRSDTLIEHQCTVSIGVALFADHQAGEDILKWADSAMYQAKASGGNAIYFSDANA